MLSTAGKTNNKQSGFTLTELLISISIIISLVTIGMITYQGLSKKGRDAKRQSDLAVIQGSLQQYYADQNFFPAPNPSPFTSGSSLNSNTGNPAPKPSPFPIYLNKIPTDPVAANSNYCYKPSPDSCDNSDASKCSSYSLFAKLENAASGTLSCGGSSNYNYQLTPP